MGDNYLFFLSDFEPEAFRSSILALETKGKTKTCLGIRKHNAIKWEEKYEENLKTI